MINFSLHKSVRRSYQPKRADIKKWLMHSLVANYNSVFIDLVIVSESTSQELNNQYRQRNTPTNVISLEYSSSRDEFSILNGELIFCDAIIVSEASSQNRSIMAHYAHMFVHGLLHLQGYDHIHDDDALKMESLEKKILLELGYDIFVAE